MMNRVIDYVVLRVSVPEFKKSESLSSFVTLTTTHS